MTPPPGRSEAPGTSLFVFGVSALPEELMKETTLPLTLATLPLFTLHEYLITFLMFPNEPLCC